MTVYWGELEMTREEAIAKLESLVYRVVDRSMIDDTCHEVIEYLEAQEPKHISYDNGEDLYALIKVMSEIHDLLKLRESRVMTLEEVCKAYVNPLWFESKDTFMGEKGFWVLSKGVSPSFRIRFIPAVAEDGMVLSLADYGKFWRCWTSCPSAEEMEATPWEYEK